MHEPFGAHEDYQRLMGEAVKSLQAEGILNPQKLPASLCGARYDAAFLQKLPFGVDPCGEIGEFRTIVAHAPGFAKRLAFEKGEIVERSGFVYCDFIIK